MTRAHLKRLQVEYMDYSLPGSSAHGILQPRIMEWVAMPSPRGSSQPRDQTYAYYVSCIGMWVLYYYHTWEGGNSLGILASFGREFIKL